jgi:tetratricopeptide (TPR) repeat protein
MRSSRRRAARLAGLAAGFAFAAAGMAADIEALWEYDDPAASEARFESALASARGDRRLELLTQVARTWSLRGNFAEAHRLLDEVETQLCGAGARPRVRYLLERGRTFNSAGERERARALFLQAFVDARKAGEEGLEVDAAHMVAITSSGREEGLEWTRRGLALAEASKDAKAQALVPAMLNNSAWDLLELDRHEEALASFRAAERAWTRRGGPAQVAIAKWSVAHCLRVMGRAPEALAILVPLAGGARCPGARRRARGDRARRRSALRPRRALTLPMGTNAIRWRRRATSV